MPRRDVDRIEVTMECIRCGSKSKDWWWRGELAAQVVVCGNCRDSYCKIITIHRTLADKKRADAEEQADEA